MSPSEEITASHNDGGAVIGISSDGIAFETTTLKFQYTEQLQKTFWWIFWMWGTYDTSILFAMW